MDARPPVVRRRRKAIVFVHARPRTWRPRLAGGEYRLPPLTCEAPKLLTQPRRRLAPAGPRLLGAGARVLRDSSVRAPRQTATSRVARGSTASACAVRAPSSPRDRTIASVPADANYSLFADDVGNGRAAVSAGMEGLAKR